MEYQLVISINVHEKYDFLLKQLENIKNNVSIRYCIIINCNQYMYECINNLPDNVYINPTIINKRLYHGSIAQGIYSNMVYALQHFKFNYFLVCSSRNFFENNLTIEKLNNLIYIKHSSKIQIRKLQYTNHSYNDWLWPHLSKSLLFQYIISKNEKLYNTPH
jgi:hypothetical protein